MARSKQKYGNKKVTIGEIEFDSIKEGKRYLVLKKAQEDGLISGLTLQPKWEVLPAKKEMVRIEKQLKTKVKVIEKERTLMLPIHYTADFSYIKDGVLVVEDVKSTPRLLSRDVPLRLKLMKYFHNIDVRLIYDVNAKL